MKRYAVLIPLKKGQAIIFDHKLIHYSPPNHTSQVRVAIQSVVKPAEVPACHYVFDSASNTARAYRISKEFILGNDLWNGDISSLTPDHEQPLIPFPGEEEVIQKLVQIKTAQLKQASAYPYRKVLADENLQQSFAQNGFVKLPLLNDGEVQQLKELFTEYTGGNVSNTDYGMYISLEENDITLKQRLIKNITGIVFDRVNEHFINCKQHLGSFLVKAPGVNSYTYPHQDWTFVASPPYNSVTIWIALTDTNESNGALGFIRGSHLFFDSPVGSPSPEFKTCTQGHEDIFYEYLEFVPLKAGEAIAFDNRTIHGATPNLSNENRLAVAIGMTPAEAPLYHYYLLPDTEPGEFRKIVRLKVNDSFFHRHSLKNLKELYMQKLLPDQCEIDAVLQHEFNSFSRKEIQELCRQTGLQKNGRQLIISGPAKVGKASAKPASVVARIWGQLFKSKNETTV